MTMAAAAGVADGDEEQDRHEEQAMAREPKGGKVDTQATPTTLGHNPFAALQAVRDALPEGPVPSSRPTTATAATTATKEFLEKVVVRRERKGHGGKTVTVVSGVAPAAREAVCAALKKALGCGARVEGDDVVVQGDLVDRCVAFVEARGARRVVRGS
jgi:translation initiation factor 1